MIDPRAYLKAIRKYWWIVIAAILAAVGAGAAVTINSTPLYQSNVRFYVNTPADGVLAAYQGDEFGRNRVNSYIQLFNTDKLADLVISDSSLPLTVPQVLSRVKAVGDETTVLINVTVTDAIPSQAQAIAKSLATQFPAMITGIETPKGALTSPVQVDVVSGPTLNTTAVSPSPTRNLTLAFVIGLLFGCALAIAREVLDNTVRTITTVAKISKAPFLGIVTLDEKARRNPVIGNHASRSVRAESIRQLRTNLRFVAVDSPVKVIAVTSAVSGEGKTSTAVNLALSFSSAGRRVLLMDADLRKPMVATYLEISDDVGLTDVLLGDVVATEAMQRWGDTGLNVMGCGSVAPNPSELLSSQTMTDLVISLREQFDVIVIDTTPLLPVTDGAVVAREADGALLVVRHGSTTRTQLTNAVRNLHSVGARVLGGTLNMVPLRGTEAWGADFGLEGSNDEYFENPRERSVTKAPREALTAATAD